MKAINESSFFTFFQSYQLTPIKKKLTPTQSVTYSLIFIACNYSLVIVVNLKLDSERV